MLHFIEEEAARCLLCADAPCSRACKNGDPARALRAIRFGNRNLAGRWIEECTDDDLEAAEKACIHYDRPIRIKELPAPLRNQREGENSKTDTSTSKGMKHASLEITFCGIPCENPFFLASSAICTKFKMGALPILPRRPVPLANLW